MLCTVTHHGILVACETLREPHDLAHNNKPEYRACDWSRLHLERLVVFFTRVAMQCTAEALHGRLAQFVITSHGSTIKSPDLIIAYLPR